MWAPKPTSGSGHRHSRGCVLPTGVRRSCCALPSRRELKDLWLRHPTDQELGPEVLHHMTPTMVIAGDHDGVLLEHTIAIWRSIDHAALFIVPDTGHNTLGERPGVAQPNDRGVLRPPRHEPITNVRLSNQRMDGARARPSVCERAGTTTRLDVAVPRPRRAQQVIRSSLGSRRGRNQDRPISREPCALLWRPLPGQGRSLPKPPYGSWTTSTS